MAIAAWVLLSATQVVAEEDTWMYAVQISAVVQASPPKITLNWEPDAHIATNYTIYRKAKDETSWGAGTTLPGTALSFVDTDVEVGRAYEYQIVKDAILPVHTGYGYIYTGIEAPLTETRGKLILIVANTHANVLSNELARLENDLEGDGWTVIRHNVSSADIPANVRDLIINDYNNDPVNVNAVFLFGHVPVLHSGNLDYDGHLARPMPADAFYGDMSGDWSGSPDFLPADVELMVGRVDMFNMPGNGAATAWPTEVELLRNYLNKDHKWRHKMVTVTRRALIGNRRGDELGEASAASGYRNFEPFVGPGNTIEANTEDQSPPPKRWGPMLAADDYLWAFGCAGGMPDGISHLGTVGEYNSLFSTNIVAQDAQAVFVMLFGSWFAEWDVTDNFMRAFLATPSLGLTCCMSGRPHWFLHHMGLGEPIGYSTRLTMNNATLYQNQSNGYTRAIYISLMGDPTLRMDMVSPPAALSAIADGQGMNLNWSPSAEPVAGYHVYRKNASSESFVRVNESLLTETSFSDVNAGGAVSYMVRAVKLQTTPSGTYYNASQGVFASAVATLRVSAAPTPEGVTLTWKSVPNVIYRVLAKDDLNGGDWSDVSGDITATETATSWTDVESGARPQRFYQVASP